MKALAVSGLALWCVAAASVAHALPADDPLHGIELGMSQPQLKAQVETAGGKLDCREHNATVNGAAAQVQYCRAELESGGQRRGRIEAMLAPTAAGAARVVVFAVQGPAADASGVRDRLVRKWGKPALSPAETAGFLETAKWRLGGRLLVHADGCRRGRSSCVEYSESAWARQAARAVGMEFAVP
jgi:hypothetical protein